MVKLCSNGSSKSADDRHVVSIEGTEDMVKFLLRPVKSWGLNAKKLQDKCNPLNG